MDLSTIHKILLSLAAMLPFARYFFDLRFASRSRLKEEYLFARDFMSELKNQTDMHRVVKEKGYQLVIDNFRLNGNEIENLLDAQLPLEDFNYFPKAKRFIDMNFVRTNSTLRFTKKLASKKARLHRKLLCGGLYTSFAVLALAPLTLPEFTGLTPHEASFFFIVTLTCFTGPAWHYLSELMLITRIEKTISKITLGHLITTTDAPVS